MTRALRRTRLLGAPLAALLLVAPDGAAARAPAASLLVMVGDPTASAEAPAIDAVEPAEIAAGAVITARGRGFAEGDVLRLDGKPLADVKVDADRITATVPAATKAGKTLTVARGGKVVATSTAFAFISAPKVTSVKPAFAAPGEVVTVTGAGLDRITALTLAGADVAIDAQDAKSLRFTVPLGAQTGELAVRGPGGGASLKRPYEIFYAPALAGVSPSAAFEGDAVLVQGQHLVGEGKGKVTFRIGAKALKVVEAGAQGVTVTVAKGAKTGPLSAEARKRRSTLGEDFTVHRTPVISKAPATVGAPGVLQVTGKNLDVVSAWRLGAVELTQEPDSQASPTRAALRVPAEASGAAPLEAVAFGRAFASKKSVTVVRAPVLAAIRLLPAKKGVEGVVRGEHLTPQTKLTIAGKPAKVAYVDPTRLTFSLAQAPAGEVKATATTGGIAGVPLAFDADAEGYRHSFARLDALLAAPPADYPPLAVELDVEQSRAALPEPAAALQALAAQAGAPAGRAAVHDRGIRISYDLQRMLIAQQALCAAMKPGKAAAADNTAAGEALRAATARAGELVASLAALWHELPADVVLAVGADALALEQVDQNVAAALAARPRVAKACAGKFHGDRVVSDAARTADLDLAAAYDRAIVASFKKVLDRGKTWPEVEKPVVARLAAFAPARAAVWKAALQASKKAVEAGAGQPATGKGARGDKKVEPAGKPPSNKPGKQGK